MRLALIGIERVENGFIINVQKDGDACRLPFPQLVARNSAELGDILSELLMPEIARAIDWAKEIPPKQAIEKADG